MKILSIALGVICALIMPAYAQQKQPAEAETALEGEWTQAADGSGYKIVFAGDKMMTFKPNGMSEGDSTFTVRPDTKPAEIDIRRNKRTTPCIYKIEEKGTLLTIALNSDGKNGVRPAEFVGSDEVRVLVLHRKKENVPLKVVPRKPAPNTVLEGEWNDKADGSGVKVVFAGDKMTGHNLSGEIETNATFTLRADKKEIDLHIEKGGRKLTFPGIYKIEDDGKRLTIANSARREGAVRPTEYVAGGENNVRVTILHRQKPK